MAPPLSNRFGISRKKKGLRAEMLNDTATTKMTTQEKDYGRLVPREDI